MLISAWFPYPPNNGSKIRSFNLLCQLSKSHELHLFTFAGTREEEEQAVALERYCERVVCVDENIIEFRRGGLRGLTGLASLKPRSVRNFRSKVMERLVDDAAGRDRFDAVLATGLGAAEYALRVRGVPKVLDEHNVESLFARRLSGLQKSHSRRLRHWLTWIKASRYESRLCRAFDVCTVVSEVDRNELLKICRLAPPIEIVPNGVDCLRHRARISSKSGSPTLVYNGALTYSANEAAVSYFCDHILPRVKEKVPQVKLTVTGSFDANRHGRFENVDGVALTGHVSDVRPHVARSRACVVPLTLGGGTRLKILEAMALGTPVVATSIGAEGLDVRHGKNILIADDAEAFADHAVALLQDASLGKMLAAEARKLVEAKYDWRAIGQTMDGVLAGVAASGCGKFGACETGQVGST